MKHKYIIKTVRAFGSTETQVVIEREAPLNKLRYKILKDLSFPYIDAYTDVLVEFYHDDVIQDKYIYITSRMFDGYKVIGYVFYGNYFEEVVLAD